MANSLAFFCALALLKHARSLISDSREYLVMGFIRMTEGSPRFARHFWTSATIW